MKFMHKLSEQEWLDSIERVGVVVGCIIYRNRKYLMVQENQVKARGLWNIPAGHVDKDESLEVAAVREAKEETGFDIKLAKELFVIHETVNSSVKHVFEAHITKNSDMDPSDFDSEEIMSVSWLDFNEITALYESGKIRKPWVYDAIRQYNSSL